MRLSIFFSLTLTLLICTTAHSASTASKASDWPPPRNPYLADSQYPIIHADAASSDTEQIAGPVGPSRQLDDSEIIWKKLGPITSFEITYSGKYPEGRRVIWTGGYDRIVKLDAKTLETLAELKLEGEGVHYWTDKEIEDYVNEIDHLSGQPLYDKITKTIVPIIPTAGSAYHFIDNNNDLYIFQSSLGTSDQYLRVYGDSMPGDPDSPIVLKREWKLPSSIAPKSVGIALGVTYDGTIIIVTTSGVVFAVSRDFKNYQYLRLPGSGEENNDLFSAFVRNGVAIDDDGGIYIVSAKYMQRVQWTGKKLSMDPKDGAWYASYPRDKQKKGQPSGSGSTPDVIGFGKNADKLVVIDDDKFHSNLAIYWRDKIPADWKGLPGQPRRMAGLLPLYYGQPLDPNKRYHTESSVVSWGYDMLVSNTEPGEIPEQVSPAAQFLTANHATVQIPGNLPYGNMMASWNPKTRKLERKWANSEVSCTSSLDTASSVSRMAYCMGWRDGEFTLEGIDWDTGKSAFHYGLGSSFRYLINGGVVHLSDDGVVDCSCQAGMGVIRMAPKKYEPANP